MLEDDYAPATRSLIPSWIMLIALIALAVYLFRRWTQPTPTRMDRVREVGLGAIDTIKERLPSR